MKVGIIGSGIGGLAAAVRLAVKGYDVSIFEKSETFGGKLAEIRTNGYRFDTGPSLFTLPSLIDDLFKDAGEDIQSYFSYKKLNESCKYFFADNTQLTFYQDIEKLNDEIRKLNDHDVVNLEKHLNKAKELYDLSSEVFIFNSFHKLKNYNTPPFKKVGLRFWKLNFFNTMHKANKKRFKSEKLVQIFDRYATYNGSNPYKAPATLNIIAHLENNIGAFFPENGMFSIAESLYKLAVKKGVQFHFNSEVTKIKPGEPNQLFINNTEHLFDILVSDVDVRHLTQKIFPDHPKKKMIQRPELSSSALIFYWGINKSFADLKLHNILFSKDYKAEFDALFNTKEIYKDPTVYIFISKKTVEEDAPAGKENWFVMINAPAIPGDDWVDKKELVRKNIIEKIDKTLQTNIEEYIESEDFATPKTIETKTNSFAGALYGSSSNSIFSAFLRHPNFIRKLKNMYFVGGSVHPGGGIPLCLASAKIISDELPTL